FHLPRRLSRKKYKNKEHYYVLLNISHIVRELPSQVKGAGFRVQHRGLYFIKEIEKKEKI
ncbi:MAG: hypothetical protein RBT65_08865, partial [Methanolobus sp.]|nr:hypothetical protein [Methanolobus sp.]